MKRVLAVFCGAALAFTMVAGCASTKEVKALQDSTNQALAQAQAAQQKCQASAQASEASAQRSEAAAKKSEAMAAKAEQIFMKKMKK